MFLRLIRVDCINSRFAKCYFVTLLYHIHLLMDVWIFFSSFFPDIVIYVFCIFVLISLVQSIFLNFIVVVFSKELAYVLFYWFFFFNLFLNFLSSTYIFTSFSCFLRWKLISSVLDFCSLPPPLWSIALVTSHTFWHTVFLFSVTSKYLVIFLVIFPLIHGLIRSNILNSKKLEFLSNFWKIS